MGMIDYLASVLDLPGVRKHLVAALQHQVKTVNMPFGNAVLHELCAALFEIIDFSQDIVTQYGHTMGLIDYLVNLLLAVALTWLARRLMGGL